MNDKPIVGRRLTGRIVVATALVAAPLVVAIALPVLKGHRDETGQMISWVTTPIAAALYASSSGTSLSMRILLGTIAGAIIAATTATMTYVIWRSWAEAWMIQQSGMVVALLIMSVLCGIVGSAILASLVPARTPRTSEIGQ